MHDGQHDVSNHFTRAAMMSHNKRLSVLIVVTLLYDDHSINTALCANYPERLIRKVNITGKSRLLKLNVKKTKLLKIGKMQSDAGVAVDDEHIGVVE